MNGIWAYQRLSLIAASLPYWLLPAERQALERRIAQLKALACHMEELAQQTNRSRQSPW